MSELRPRPVLMTADQLVTVLDDISERVARGDSFEGNLTYSIPADDEAPPGSFDVVAIYRVGNTNGQGGMRMYGDWEET